MFFAGVVGSMNYDGGFSEMRISYAGVDGFCEGLYGT